MSVCLRACMRVHDKTHTLTCINDSSFSFKLKGFMKQNLATRPEWRVQEQTYKCACVLLLAWGPACKSDIFCLCTPSGRFLSLHLYVRPSLLVLRIILNHWNHGKPAAANWNSPGSYSSAAVSTQHIHRLCWLCSHIYTIGFFFYELHITWNLRCVKTCIIHSEHRGCIDFCQCFGAVVMQFKCKLILEARTTLPPVTLTKIKADLMLSVMNDTTQTSWLDHD